MSKSTSPREQVMLKRPSNLPNPNKYTSQQYLKASYEVRNIFDGFSPLKGQELKKLLTLSGEALKFNPHSAEGLDRAISLLLEACFIPTGISVVRDLYSKPSFYGRQEALGKLGENIYLKTAVKVVDQFIKNNLDDINGYRQKALVYLSIAEATKNTQEINKYYGKAIKVFKDLTRSEPTKWGEEYITCINRIYRRAPELDKDGKFLKMSEERTQEVVNILNKAIQHNIHNFKCYDRAIGILINCYEMYDEVFNYLNDFVKNNSNISNEALTGICKRYKDVASTYKFGFQKQIDCYKAVLKLNPSDDEVINYLEKLDNKVVPSDVQEAQSTGGQDLSFDQQDFI